MLRAGLVAALLAASACVVSASDPASFLDLRTRPITLNPEAPSQTTVGRLHWIGGMALSARHKDFGGLSGLLLSPDGTRLIAVTDRGYWFTATLLYDDAGALTGLANADLVPLRGPEGDPLNGSRNRDAEGLARHDGDIVVSFEHNHRMLRYPATGWPDASALADTVPRPMPMPGNTALDDNSGLEALATLPGGALLAIAEGTEKDEGPLDPSPAWLSPRDNQWHTFSYPRDTNFRPTGATTMANGDLLVIERRFTVIGGVAARLRHVPAAAAAAGDLLGETVAELIPPVSVDNMEAIATRTDRAGRTLVYILSDDNFNALQRTLLMVFELQNG